MAGSSVEHAWALESATALTAASRRSLKEAYATTQTWPQDCVTQNRKPQEQRTRGRAETRRENSDKAGRWSKSRTQEHA
jgi:hypothetical protein